MNGEAVLVGPISQSKLDIGSYSMKLVESKGGGTTSLPAGIKLVPENMP